ncbi:hypothetical protein IA539_22715 [Gordonia sp. zg691]|uniref:hypothetical protein n=1 Tax=Gordonia jinghuaiqii TaxID=2758710 RepID=UPI0016625CF3|nr:hypothetical protein [Gordonia jinghuaiqii]MBD0863988.1 hypothetical protein [Gordonia jinghuaiqii]
MPLELGVQTVTTSESHSSRDRRGVSQSDRVTLSRKRIGYSATVAVNVVLLVALLGWPGWERIPFLTGEVDQVVGWVSASLIAVIVTNSVYLVVDRPLVKAAGDLVANAISLSALIRIWQVFPFDFDDGTVPWSTIARVVLIAGMAGTVVAMIVVLARGVRDGVSHQHAGQFGLPDAARAANPDLAHASRRHHRRQAR